MNVGKKPRIDSSISRRRINKIVDPQIRNVMRAGLHETAAMAYLNSGVLGYTDEDLIKDGIQQRYDDGTPRKTPITISTGLYWKHRKKLEKPSEATKELYDVLNNTAPLDLIDMQHDIKSKLSELNKHILLEKDPMKLTYMINTYIRLLPFKSSYLDLIIDMVEKRKIPMPEDMEKKLERLQANKK